MEKKTPLKKCSRCLEVKPHSDFNKRGERDTLRSHCKLCVKATCKKYKEYTPERKKYCLNKGREYRKANPESVMLYMAKVRSKQLGHKFNITVEDIFIPKYCPVLGLKLEKQNHKSAPNSPSLDRVDNTKGYIKGNVRVISKKANELKRELTLKQLKSLCLYIEEHKLLYKRRENMPRL